MIQNPAQDSAEVRHRPQTSAQKHTARLIASAPQGVTLGTWTDAAHHKKPYYVRYGAKRTLEAFADEETRNLRAEEVILERERHGSASLDYQVSERNKWLSFLRETGATLDEVRIAWTRYLVTRTQHVLTKDAVDRYLALRVSEDVDIKSNTYRQMRKHLLDWLAGTFGDRRLAEITSDDLRKLLAQVKNRDGTGPAENITKRSYRKNWNTFFKRAVDERWISDNPCAVVAAPKVVMSNKDLLAIKDAFTFLKANIDQPVMPRIALEMWGFFRASSAARIVREEVIPSEKALIMPAGKHKSGKRKKRQGHSAVLWEWLALATEETWEIGPRLYADRKAEAFTRAGISRANRAVHNILRHSCISYLLAETKNPPLVSYLAQHSQTQMTLDYEDLASEHDGKLWARLTPQAVSGAWEDFLKANQ